MNEPFAAIPLAWLKSKDPYHRFLLWVIPEIAGVDGFGGLQAGQVRFSRRQVELGLGATRHQATAWTNRAVCEGLLKPTQSYERHKGLGEIYDTGGDLRDTRQNDRPTTDQQPTNNRPTKPKKTNGLDGHFDQQPTNNRPTTDRLIDKTKKTKKDISPSREGLKQILEWDGMDWSSVFFEIFRCFPRDRVINRITLAKQFRDAVRLDGATPEQIYQSALDLSKSREPRYMPDAARWMAEQGWRAYEVGNETTV